MNFIQNKLYLILSLGVFIGTSCNHSPSTANELTNNRPQEQLKNAPIRDSSFIDPRDGKSYRIRSFGNLWWMIDNLNYSMKGVMFKGDVYIGTGSFYYDDNPDYGKKYGQLYDFPSAKEACPKGWRLPTYDEWKWLTETYRNCDPTVNGGIRDSLPIYEPIGAGAGSMQSISAQEYRAGRTKMTYYSIGKYAEYWCSEYRSTIANLTINLEQCHSSLGVYSLKTKYLAVGKFQSCRCVQEIQ